ncbi:hypothetical protein F383_12657 [Gossypium arboreum]|uniref:Uncharacterized protein n=1 Tax=Gossypium arboreum TaxID=29729 RepID=A0A0B0PWN8_GOSAR|nr:hypothetical protein F383_12657 [Gossypium arboreum]
MCIVDLARTGNPTRV